ncbi:MAG: hypothetical protein ABI383_10915 [Acidobacteriaceae bacterium]
MLRLLLIASLAASTLAYASDLDDAPTLTPQQSGTINRLQAISPVSTKVVWASGVAGTYTLTTDGGKTWKPGVVPGAEALQFRDVQGVSDKIAYLLSSGTGTDSRIYKTEDGGLTWTLQFENQNPNAFYDCFAFWTPRRGITMSDSVNGRFPVIRTTDGATWQDIGDLLPPALPGEAAFAASGTCVATQGRQRAWIGTGGATEARILATTDGGDTWNAYTTPVVQGTPSSGIFSVDFRDHAHGLIGAGDLSAPNAFSNNVARSSDGGKTWHLAAGTPFTGAIYGLSYVRTLDKDDRDDEGNDSPSAPSALQAPAKGRNHHDDDGQQYVRAVVATGPAGAAWSSNEGTTWHLLPGVLNYWAVAFASPHAGWLVGTDGRILKITFHSDDH